MTTDHHSLLDTLSKPNSPLFTEDKSPSTEFTVIGNGAGRIVIESPQLPPKTVAKIAYPLNYTETGTPKGDPFAHGTTQNAVEQFISSHNTLLTPYTLPVETHPKTHHRWLLYPKADEITDHYTLINTFDELEYHGINADDFFTPENWGWYEQQDLLIDYGYIHPDNHRCLVQIAEQVSLWNEKKQLAINKQESDTL